MSLARDALTRSSSSRAAIHDSACRLVTHTVTHQSAGLVRFLARLRHLSGEPENTLNKLRNPDPPRTHAIGDPGPKCRRFDDDVPDREGLRVRWYVPRNVSQLLIYVHGGGWVSGSTAMLETFAQQLASTTDSVVAFIEYRLAPEHPFPVPADDVVQGIEHCMSSWLEGSAPASVSGGVFLMGDSAGGQLALTALNHVNEETLRNLDGLVLVYPSIDPEMASPSYVEHAAGPTLTAADMEYCWNTYLGPMPGDGSTMTPYLCWPDRLPFPLMVAVSGLDPLWDEGRELAFAQARAGTRTNLLEYPHCPHGFLWMAGILPEARDLLAHIGDFIRSHRRS